MRDYVKIEPPLSDDPREILAEILFSKEIGILVLSFIVAIIIWVFNH